MTSPLPISVGIDGSDDALGAVRWAARYATDTNTPLRLIHSMPNPEWYLGSAEHAADAPLRDEFHALGNRHLDQAADTVHSVDHAAEVELVSTDLPIADYLERAESALIVLGSPRSGPVRDIVLGGNTIRITNRAHCPVMIRRDSAKAATDTMRPVVVGVDGSPEADEALVAGFEFARIVHCPLVAAHYWGIAPSMGMGLAAGYVDWEKVRREERRWLHEHIRPICEKFPDVSVDISSSSATASSALRSVSSSAQLIVVASRGRGKVAGTVLGSVGQNVVHHSHCSVLVVR